MKPDLEAIRARWKRCNEESSDIPALLAYIEELETERDGWAPFNDAVKNRVLHTLLYGLPPTSEADEFIVDALLAKAREDETKRPINSRKDLAVSVTYDKETGQMRGQVVDLAAQAFWDAYSAWERAQKADPPVR